MITIHNYKRNFERGLERIKENKKILKENKEIILKFKDYLLSENISISRITRYLCDLKKLDNMLKKPFPEATKEDLRTIIAQLNQTNYAEETKKCFKTLIRKLYKFIEGIDEKGDWPERVKWISISIPKNKRKLPEELLTEEEIIKIIKNCKTLRDRALIATIAESGCRVSEIGNMQIKHVSFEKYGSRITVSGKTGMRKILVINCTPYLQEWLNQHPENDNPESPLWYGQNKKNMSYTRIANIIKQAGKDAKIQKRIYPHLFRHSRATFFANKMSEASMKQYFGWGQDSKMCGIYIHMNDEMTDNSILKANGLIIEEKEEINKLQPKKCLRCYTKNETTNKFCKLCGLPLDNKEAEKIIKLDSEKMKANNLMEILFQDSELKNFIAKKLQNIKNKKM